MQTSPLNRVIHHLFAGLRLDGGELTDAELLGRFLRSGDEGPLATLVRRHASMVWNVCRRLLSHHDAEDAFQATFLVLVRRAGAVPRQAVANWLYGVARQTAVRLRATAAKHRRRETQVVNMPEPTIDEAHDTRIQAVVDEELGRLPDHYREVVLLCDLEGLTRKKAARQLGIPEGSVASRLARARVMLARRLNRRDVVLSGASLAAVLSAGSASASAPPALVASTIKAATLMAAGVISAKVAALTEGMVKAMFVTRIKSLLGLALFIATIVGAAGLIYQTHAAGLPEAKEEQPIAKQDPKQGGEKQPPAQPKQPAKTDVERMVGNWFIVNKDSGRKGEMWVISKDQILMHAKELGARARLNSYKIDAGKTPKQIDINEHVIGFTTGPSRGIYAFDGDELRICLPALGKDRPTEFASKPGAAGLVILQRQKPGAEQPTAKKEQPAQSDRERMVGEWVIANADSKRQGQLWVITKDHILMNYYGPGLLARQYHFLDVGKEPKQIDITFTPVNGPNAMKGIYLLDGDELRLCLGDRGKDRPTAFPMKPLPGEVLILRRQKLGAEQPKTKEEQPAKSDQVTQEEKLRVLIDKVLAAQGGEDKLNKLQFTMTVKHSNGYINKYWVQPPKNFRWETTFPNQTAKWIVILFPEGRRWWTKGPNEDPKRFEPTGIEPLSVEGWFDYVKFFGPRQVLRLKDAQHKMPLLDDEAKVGDRAAVGVQVTGPHYKSKMYFDKDTHLLLKGIGSDILREVTYSDYKKFDGIPIAQKEHDGHFEPRVTEFRVVEKFDAKLFEQP